MKVLHILCSRQEAMRLSIEKSSAMAEAMRILVISMQNHLPSHEDPRPVDR